MTTPRLIITGLVASTAALAPATALAKHGGDDGVRTRGTCTERSSAKLKLSRDDSRIGTEFEVDQNRNGVTWKVTIRRNGHVAVKRNMTTQAPSGSWSLERRLANSRGRDRIAARATSPSGEVCTASVSI